MRIFASCPCCGGVEWEIAYDNEPYFKCVKCGAKIIPEEMSLKSEEEI